MKGNAFGDRARQLTEWFQDWNSCEQTIALYSLLSKVSAIQARFLSLVLEHSLKNGCDSQELTRLERQANNAGTQLTGKGGRIRARGITGERGNKGLKKKEGLVRDRRASSRSVGREPTLC